MKRIKVKSLNDAIYNKICSSQPTCEGCPLWHHFDGRMKCLYGMKNALANLLNAEIFYDDQD